MTLALTALTQSDCIITGTESLLDWREKHQLKVPGHEFTPRFRNHLWNGTWTPGKWCRQRGDIFELACSRGLAPRIIRELGGVVTFDVASPDEIAEFCANTPQVAELRDYQRRALEGVLREGWARIAYATNAGKGAVIALLALYAAQHGEGALICCDEIAVFDALEGEIEKWARVIPGVVKSGIKEPPTASIVLAMVPTLARRLGSERGPKARSKPKPWTAWLASQSMLLVDEADKADVTRWKLVLHGAKKTKWRAGFSGSFPDDLLDDLKLDELMGPIIDRVTNAEMVAIGVSAKPLIEVHSYNCTGFLHSFPEEWWELPGPELRNYVYERAIIYNQQRHEFVASRIQPNTPTAVVVNRIDHGRALTEAIPGAVFLEGASSERERIAVLEDFRLGKIHVIVVTRILDRGTNRLGLTADLIFAASEGSAAQTLQRIGRGLRRAGGKEFLRLVDIIDRVELHAGARKSLKTAAAFLHGAARKRLEVYASQGFDIEVVP